jgi:diguanylate cyclase (GGDEF)-like protein
MTESIFHGVNAQGDRPPSNEEIDNNRLDALRDPEVLTLDLVSALAGDRPLSKAEALFVDNKKKSLGDRFYSDVLYAITHQYFEADIAVTLWKEIVRHKYEMSDMLKRNIRVVVASLDYLSNITGDINATTLISENHIADIVDVSLRDGLTGLFGHEFFYRRTDFEIKRSARYGNAVSLMMIDIDNFKQFNDTHGHQEGDAILKAVGSTIETETRDADICCRYGGEEFAVLLPSTDRTEALVLAERLRTAIENGLPEGKKVTASIGVAVSTAFTPYTAQGLVKEADKALYNAKSRGKNSVCDARGHF